MAVETPWSFYAAVVLFSVQSAHCHRISQGLSCTTDFVSNISCAWNSSAFEPGVDCWVFGVRRQRENFMIQWCKLQQHEHSPPGCSIFYEKKKFNGYESMPNISLTCNGTLVETLTMYYPGKNIKMHPPGVPNVNISANEVQISWNPGSPRSTYFKEFNFEVEIKQNHQKWKEAQILPTQEQALRRQTKQLQGPHQVRVRVKPVWKHSSHWSDWSQTASWVGPTDPAPQHPGWIEDQMSWLILAVVIGLSLIAAVSLVVYRSCFRRILQKRKEVPNPSQYFRTLHSVHGGNLKKWLNPLAAPELFFTAGLSDHMSAVEVCDSWNVIASSPSSSSSTALLHFRSYPSPASDTGGVVDNSSSSSCFSNMGYFMSSYTSGSAQTEPSSPYFTYKEDFPRSHNSPSLQLSLCPPLSSSNYESLKVEPQSPDSGFGIGNESDDMDMDVEYNEDAEDIQSTPLLILPLMSFCPPPPPQSPTQESSVRPLMEEPAGVAAAPAGDGSYAAWPMAGPMCRSSSMPVESSQTGYLTLKELQTTFSNKSI